MSKADFIMCYDRDIPVFVNRKHIIAIQPIPGDRCLIFLNCQECSMLTYHGSAQVLLNQL